MHRISNFTGQARHGWERMTPAFGIGRPNQDVNAQVVRRSQMSIGGHPSGPESTVTLSFNVPFSSNLAGPDPDEIIHSSPGARDRWCFPESTPEGTSTHQLPVHTNNVESLKRLCQDVSQKSSGRIEAFVSCSEPRSVSSIQRRPQSLVTNICITGDGESVQQMRSKILKETPIALECAHVDVDVDLLADPDNTCVRDSVLAHLDTLATYTGADIFLLKPRNTDTDSATVSWYDGDTASDMRYRVAMYSDIESAEHAKMRVLIMIDQILKRQVDVMILELSIHSLLCGRTRRNIKLIEAETNTAIYFPPPFPRAFGYSPPGAHRRSPDEIYITGDTQEQLTLAKQKLSQLAKQTNFFAKEVIVSPNKIDNILLERLDKVRKVMKVNGSHVVFPRLGSRQNVVCVRGTEFLHVERTIKEIMALAGQFYSASWWIVFIDHALRPPSSPEIRSMLSDVCVNSGADVSFEKLTFSINGSDEAVKAAMNVIHQVPFVMRSPYQMRVKVELANEHKEFVSGKKNGKINKIMGQSNVQIMFDSFNEYNFYIDVCGAQYESTKNGLVLVEAEMPASISFHVPDQYHKRIIGIGGQHIQRIMKKYSVFVKFSNAMDRGATNKYDDGIKADNVICRTPARNAQSLDLVKQEIMDMVEKADAEFVSETVSINRLYHRELIIRMKEIEALEKRYNCKIDFPSTELASDAITISGPEYQVTQAVDAFLRMVPESHELLFQSSSELRAFFASPEFRDEVCCKLKEQYEVHAIVEASTPMDSEGQTLPNDTIILRYTRNNVGGLKDAIDFLIPCLVTHGVDAATVKGAIPRPKSDSFENSLPFFESKLLQHAPAPLGPESSGRVSLDEKSDRASLFGRLRKPGSVSSFSSFIGRKASISSGSFFRQASSNASKTSLVSMESRDSGYRNPWNDSGVNLPAPEEEIITPPIPPPGPSQNGSHGWSSVSSFDKLRSSFTSGNDNGTGKGPGILPPMRAHRNTSNSNVSTNGTQTVIPSRNREFLRP